jgi:hypothetical protein
VEVEMRIEVVVPSLSIGGEIDRDILNNAIPLSLPDTESALNAVVEAKVAREVRSNDALLRGARLPERFVVEVLDDFGSVRPEHLAHFDADRTDRTGDSRFGVSAQVAYAELLASHALASPNYPLSAESYWSHEFVHLRDREVLTSLHRAFERDESVSADAWRQFPALREWELLNLLARYRSEGLATLYECLCGERELQLSGVEAREEFRRLMDAWFGVIGRPFSAELARDFDARRLEPLRLPTRILAYEAGAYLMLDAIAARQKRVGPSTSPPLAEARRALDRRGLATLSREDAVRVVEEGLAMDLATYVDSVCRPDADHPWGTFLDLEALGSLLHHISSLGSEEDGRLLGNVIGAVSRSDAIGFLAALRREIGASMDEAELRREYESFRAASDAADVGPVPAEVSDEIRSSVSRLMETLNGKNDRPRAAARAEIAVAALTYVFDKEDYIGDDTRILGYIDDLHVLRAARAFLR